MNYRRFTAPDRNPVYRMFRESLWDFMLASGLVGEDDENDIAATLESQRPIYEHLERTAQADWIAEDDSGRIVGWARVIERDRHLQLTHFFVDPSTQGAGVGRALLDRAFAHGSERQRSVIATTNPSALSLYLRYGVSVQGFGFCMYGTPLHTRDRLDSALKLADADAASLDAVLQIERQVLGYERTADLEFLATQQPLYLLQRDGEVQGYAFGSNAHHSGPAATLDPADLPLVLQAIEASAIEAGREQLWLTVPAVADSAVQWLLGAGYRIDPFYEVLLAQQPTIQLDRYLLTECSFIW